MLCAAIASYFKGFLALTRAGCDTWLSRLAPRSLLGWRTPPQEGLDSVDRARHVGVEFSLVCVCVSVCLCVSVLGRFAVQSAQR